MKAATWKYRVPHSSDRREHPQHDSPLDVPFYIQSQPTGRFHEFDSFDKSGVRSKPKLRFRLQLWSISTGAKRTFSEAFELHYALRELPPWLRLLAFAKAAS